LWLAEDGLTGNAIIDSADLLNII